MIDLNPANTTVINCWLAGWRNIVDPSVPRVTVLATCAASIAPGAVCVLTWPELGFSELPMKARHVASRYDGTLDIELHSVDAELLQSGYTDRRADGFDQRAIDAAKAVLLAPGQKRGGR